MHTFVPNKLFGQLIEFSLSKSKISKAFDSGFSYSEVWSTDTNSKPLETIGKTDLFPWFLILH